MRVPNVRSWAVGVTEPLADLIQVHSLPQIEIDPKQTPPDVSVKPVVGGRPEEVMTLDRFRVEWPLLRTAFQVAQDLHEAANPGSASELGLGPTFEELLDLAQRYLDHRTRTLAGIDPRDYFWRRQVVDVLETAVRGAGAGRTAAVPMLGSPEWLDTSRLRRFRWTGLVAAGRKCHTNKAPCHTDLEKQFADFLDRSKDVVRWFKNERLGFSVTYYEGNRPRQYHPDFLVTAREADGREVLWVIETKGEIRPNTNVKTEAAELWCQRMSTTRYGSWRYLFVQQKRFETALAADVRSLGELVDALVRTPPEQQLKIVPFEEARRKAQMFKTLLPLYGLRAAAGYFGDGEAVEPEGWIEAAGVGRLDERMFVCRAVGRSMEPTIRDGDYLVFRAKPEGTRQDKIVLAGPVPGSCRSRYRRGLRRQALPVRQEEGDRRRLATRQGDAVPDQSGLRAHRAQGRRRQRRQDRGGVRGGATLIRLFLRAVPPPRRLGGRLDEGRAYRTRLRCPSRTVRDASFRWAPRTPPSHTHRAPAAAQTPSGETGALCGSVGDQAGPLRHPYSVPSVVGGNCKFPTRGSIPDVV